MRPKRQPLWPALLLLASLWLHARAVAAEPVVRTVDAVAVTAADIDRWFQHVAITVADTDSSLAYYRDALGRRVAGTSENYGSEQEHLNSVFGARLRIAVLRAGSGPGVELLEYLAPRDGRPMPVDTRSNDLWRASGPRAAGQA